MTDDRSQWMLDKIIGHERELGASEARHSAHEESIERVATEMEKGFTKLEAAQLQGFNALRGEMVADAQQRERQRQLDNAAITAAIDEVKQERANFGRALSRVAWAIIAAVVAAAATQYAALSPQVAGIASRALDHLQ